MIEHNGELAYRLSIAPNHDKAKHANSGGGEHAHHQKEIRNKRFDGQASEKGGLYYSVSTGQRLDTNDRDVAIALATQQLSLDPSSLLDAKRISRFGPHYDFRNKRLPVWQIKFDSDLGDIAFIDPATGILVDRLVDTDRYEGYSFSFLHKWNFLTPFVGREVRDIIIALILILIMVFVGLGLSMRRRH